MVAGERQLRQTQKGPSAPAQLLELDVDCRNCAMCLDSELPEYV